MADAGQVGFDRQEGRGVMIETDRPVTRKIQRKHDSYLLTMPKAGMGLLNLTAGSSVRFHFCKDKIVLTCYGKTLTKKDHKEIDQIPEAHMDGASKAYKKKRREEILKEVFSGKGGVHDLRGLGFGEKEDVPEQVDTIPDMPEQADEIADDPDDRPITMLEKLSIKTPEEQAAFERRKARYNKRHGHA